MLESLEQRHLLAITVDTPDDITDPNDGLTSLREAVSEAAMQAGHDTIDFHPDLYVASPATITLVRTPGGRGQPAVGPLNIDSEVTIQGPGADLLTIRGEGAEGEVQVTVTSGVTVDFVDLTITGGSWEGLGAGINASGSILTLQRVVITGNTADGGGGVWAEGGGSITVIESTIDNNYGGGISVSNADLTIVGSTISNNSGGGIEFYSAGGHELSIISSTISGNVGNAVGGLSVNGNGQITIVNTTITNNTSDTSASYSGGLRAAGSYTSATLHNTIVADNWQADGSPSDIVLTSSASLDANSSHNLIGQGGSGGLNPNLGNQLDVADPGLSPLGDHGGPTLTHALLPDSPAIDAGSDDEALETIDQRGFARNADSGAPGPSGGTVDIGAYEYEFSGLVAPREVHAAAIGTTSIQVTWQAAAYATSYAVLRRQPDTETEYTLIAVVNPATTYTDNNVTKQTLYEYSIVALNASGFSAASQVTHAAAGQANLTAYRPQSLQDPENPVDRPIYDRSTDGGFPGGFPKKPVHEYNEMHNAFGPGIRINFDFDPIVNGISTENDLIEVKIDRLPGQGDLILNRSGALVLYYDHDKETPIPLQDPFHTEPLQFTNDTATVFVEWAAPQHGTDILSLLDATTFAAQDSIRFHSFRSIVAVFGGRGQDPADTDGDGSIGDVVGGNNREGIFDLAQSLYNSGWDVMAFEVPESPFVNVDEIIGVAETEIVNAVTNRFVGNFHDDFGGISIIGYSWGGGVTRDLIPRLWQNYNINMHYGVYLDAVNHPTPFPETDWPEGAFYLLNIYHNNPLPGLRGGEIDEDDVPPGADLDDINTTTEPGFPGNLNHFSIDDDPQVQQRILLRLSELMFR